METSLHARVVAALMAMPRDEWPKVAAEADVPLPTLTKVAYEHTPNPRIHTVEALARAIDRRQAAAAS